MSGGFGPVGRNGGAVGFGPVLSGRRGSDRGAVARHLCGAGAGTWQPRGNGVLIGRPGAERETDRWDPTAAIF
jgi:hypothetical protein